MPKKVEQSTLEFWNGTAEEYKGFIEAQLRDKGISDFWIKTILMNAPKKGNLRILDVGTGPGFFTINLSRLGHRVIGIDVSEGMIRVAEENAAASGVDCEFRIMNANDLSYPDGEFDLIISRNVTWTLPDLFDCYREWRRVLAPDGKVVVFDANHYLNVFDEEKAKILRRRMRDHLLSGGGQYSDHFDFHVRWTYWEERPMVGTPRPEWDTNMLVKLRYLDVRSEYVSPDEKRAEPGASDRMFMVTARKPGRREEDDFIVNEYWSGISGCVSARTVMLLKDGKGMEYVDRIWEYIGGSRNVLDIGAGSGIISIPLSMKGLDVTAADRSPAMIDMLDLTASEFSARVKTVVCSADDMPFGSGSFDCVILRNILWNSYEPEAIIRESFRVLRPGGTIIITDGEWMGRIRTWETEHTDQSFFPNCKKRDLGLGARDVIDTYYDRLPLNGIPRPEWDIGVLESLGTEVVESTSFADPAVTEDLVPVLGTGFITVCRKPDTFIG